MAAKVTYLGHSGFMVETEDQILLFDCIARETPESRDTADRLIRWEGAIRHLPQTMVSHGIMPELDSRKKITAFITHSHGDHYSPDIWKLMKKYPDVRYVAGFDIRPDEAEKYTGMEGLKNICFAQADEEYRIEGRLEVQTLFSTDEGVAYFVTLEDGTSIFHAGDLLMWLWDEHTPEENEYSVRMFHRELARITGRRADIAFLPLDPRLGPDRQALSIDAYLKAMDVRFALPMHFWKRYDVVRNYVESAKLYPFRKPVHAISHEDQTYEVDVLRQNR